MAIEQNNPTLTKAARLRFACSACGKGLSAPVELAGKKVKCPKCGKPTPVPVPEPELAEEIPQDEAAHARIRIMPILAVLGVMLVVIACSVYANLAFAVSDRTSYKYFPPFKPYVN